MIICLLNNPSDLAVFAQDAARALVQRTLGAAHWISAGTAAEVETALTTRTHDHLVITSDIPEISLAHALLKANLPILIFDQEPREVIETLMETRGLPLEDALHWATKSMACLSSFALAPQVRSLKLDAPGMTVSTLLTIIAEQCRITISPADIEDLAETFMTSRSFAPQTELRHLRTGRRAEASKEPSPDVLRMLSDLRRTPEAPSDIEWPTVLFRTPSPDHSKNFVTAPIDLTGRARLIAYGPYLHLPAGAWRAEVAFSVSQNQSGNRLLFDVFGGGVLAAGEVDLPQEGTFSVDLAFKVTEPKTPIEIRVHTLEGAIEGSFELKAVTVHRSTRA